MANQAKAHNKCLISSNHNPDLHHVKTRKSGGCDSDFNLMPLHRIFHVEVHKIGLNKFAEKYPPVKKWLLANGWNFNEFKKKWVRY